MKKFLLFVMMCVCVSIGAWAATVTDLQDWTLGRSVGTITVDGTSAVIKFTEAPTNLNLEPINQVQGSLTDIKVIGPMPTSISEKFNQTYNQYSIQGFQVCERMDFSEATANIPTSVENNSYVKGIILPSSSDFSSITTGTNVEYIVKAKDGSFEENAMEVMVKSGTSWANDPIIEDASYLKVYGSDGSSYLESDDVTALKSTKWVNGECTGTIITIADLTIDANTQDEAAELADFLTSHKIKNLTVSGTVENLSIFDQIAVMNDVDFSGITNSDLSTLKLPTTTGRISLPGGTYHNGTVTLDATYTQDQLSNILAALSNSGCAVNTIAFAGGSTFNCNTNELEVSTTDEDGGKLATIANDLRAAGKTIGSVRLEKYGTSWSDNKMILSSDHSDQEVAQKALLENAGFTVSTTKVTKYPDVEVTVDENGVVTVKSFREGALKEMLEASDDEANSYKAIINADTAKGEGSKLVLEGAFKEGDLSQLTSLNKATESVDMSNTTFSNAADAKFTYWGENTLKEAKVSRTPNLTTVSSSMFQNLKALRSVTISGNIETIGSGAFLNFSTLQTVIFETPSSLRTIESNAFCASGISGDLVIPSSVKTIGNSAFQQCTALTSVTIPADSQLDYIGSQAFNMNYNDEQKKNVPLKNVYVYAEREIDCAYDAWDLDCVDGQTHMETIKTRLIYPPSMYYWYVGEWKSRVRGGIVQGQNDLITIRDGVSDNATECDGVTVTPKKGIGWQRFMSTGINVTGKAKWRTYSDIAPLRVPAFANNVAEVYVVCGYEGGKAVLKQMNEGDIIPANTGLVIHHHVTDTEFGGLLSFPALTREEIQTLKETEPEKLMPYLTILEGDKRALPIDEGGEGRATRKYVRDGVEYNNYLEALYTQGNSRAIYNAENGLYKDGAIEDKTYLMNKGGSAVYRNFFFANGHLIATWRDEGENGKKRDWTGDNWTSVEDNMGWGFFRSISGMYDVNAKAFLHLPATLFTEKKGVTITTDISEDETLTILNGSKGMDLFLLDPFVPDPVVEDNIGIATKIDNSFASDEVSDSYYTVQGVKVKSPVQKGLYIHKGKKIVVK